uniref:Uncharacterized protein n=1 Tax=Mesocestoides corti TaxID=53468 RepID=A0A5K3FKX6_MESCO
MTISSCFRHFSAEFIYGRLNHFSCVWWRPLTSTNRSHLQLSRFQCASYFSVPTKHIPN